jgi:hypothetical protein
MTPDQFYFPYFFSHNEFNKLLKRHGLSSCTTSEKTQIPEILHIRKRQSFPYLTIEPVLLSIGFGNTIMIEEQYIFYWKTDEDIIDIHQVYLPNIFSNLEVLHTTIHLNDLSLGLNNATTNIKTKGLVTYARKNSLKYDLPFSENFVVAIIKPNSIELIPFDFFNKKGGDYGYIWPATARVDLDSMSLSGKGMRMADFEVTLNKASP